MSTKVISSRWLWGVVLLWWPVAAMAQAGSSIQACGPTDQLRWDYPSPPATVKGFEVYVRPDGGTYNMALPHAAPPAVPALVTSVPCDKLILGTPGVYYAIVVAVDISGDKSPPSDEIAFQWGAPAVTLTAAPPPASQPPSASGPKPVSLPPMPPSLTAPTPPPKPQTSPSSDVYLTDTCLYRGNCAR
jgi:hypothetical protein